MERFSMTFLEFLNIEQNELNSYFNNIINYVMSSFKVYGKRVGFNFPKQNTMPINQGLSFSPIAKQNVLAAHYEIPGIIQNENNDWENRHKKGWQAYKGMSAIQTPDWDAKQQNLFKSRLTNKLAKIAQSLGFLFEIEVFQYLERNGMFDADKGIMQLAKVKKTYVDDIVKHTGTAANLILEMLQIHVKNLADQIIEKSKKILGCADMIWFTGGTKASWEGRNSPADIYIGCSEVEEKTGFSVKFGSETRINLASLSLNTVITLLNKSFKLQEIEKDENWSYNVSKMLYEAAQGMTPARFVSILNYLITGRENVIPAFRNYASTELGNAGWSENIQKDFLISKKLSEPLKARQDSEVVLDFNSTYMKATYKVPNGSYSGTFLLFVPNDPSIGKINIKVNNMTSSRR